MKIDFLLLSIVIIIILLFTNNIIEGYDEKIIDSTLENCARYCKLTENCTGFFYDHNNNICYPSKNKTDYENINTKKWYYENKKDFIQCNKKAPIKTINVYNTHSLSAPNATYGCTNLDKNDKIKQQVLSQIEEHEFDPHDPQKVIMLQDYNKVYFLNKHESSNPMLTHYDIMAHNWEDAEMKSWLELEKYHINKEKNRSIKNLTPRYGTIELDGYISTNDYNNGEFLKDYQCLDNIEFVDCINYCSNNKECKGVEFIPHHIEEVNGERILKKNMCCPKSSIGNFVERPLKYSNGRFYKKEKLILNKNKLKNNYIIKY